MTGRSYERDLRQGICGSWVQAAFGAGTMRNLEERALRVAEEAIELAQALGAPPHRLHSLVLHVYGRPSGLVPQEIGGVGVTLLALAEACGISADAAEQAELTRVMALPLEHFRARWQWKIDSGIAVRPHAGDEGGAP